MQNLTEAQQVYWNSYLETLPEGERPKSPDVTASFAGTKEITDELLVLYLEGKKTAGSSVVEDFQSAGDSLPALDDYWIYLNSKEEPSLILRTEKIEINNFLKVPERIAIAEGEGDLSLAYWRKVHSEIYSPYLKSWGLKTIEEATIITEFFKIVYI